MDNLIAWLRAQLDDDERVARDASHGGRWRYPGSDSVAGWTLYDEHWSIASMTTYDTKSYNYAERMPAFRPPGYIDADANGHHIARWDPARVLALVADIRRMIQMFEQRANEGQQPGGEVFGYHATGMLTAIRCVAEGLYAEREGYRDEWRA